VLIVAQRLVRLICPDCREEYAPDEKILKHFGSLVSDVTRFYRGKGCEKFGYSGYFGRTAIFEMLEFNEKIRALVLQGASEDDITAQAVKDGMKTLAEAGIEKVRSGLVMLEEIAKVAEAGEAAREVPAILAKKRERPLLLIVDDEVDLRKVIEKRLKMAGYDVLLAGDGRSGIEIAAREKPDLIIMDVMMPGMSGFEATETLRSRLETAVIPIVMLTAKQDKESELRGIKAGADDYLTKPFDKEKLLARIDMLLRRRARS
jgi:CheY-like chemotaxis protein